METVQPTMNNTNIPVTGDNIDIENADIIIDDTFSYEGYQVVRGEFFAHMHEPSITFNNCKVTLNTACIRRLPSVNYIQFLVNPQTMKIVVRPSREDVKDSFLWCTEKMGKKKPKQMTCRLFFAKLVALMNWNPDYRYKMLGKIIKSGDEYLIIFDLTATETYQRIIKDGEKPRTSRTPIFPEEWKDQLGLPVEEHKKLLQVNIFDGYTVFGLQDEKKVTDNSENQTKEEKKSDSNSSDNIFVENTIEPTSTTVNTYPQQNISDSRNDLLGDENNEYNR